MSGVWLNLGCGEFYAPRWVNLDVWCGDPVRPDIRASGTAMPIRTASVDRCYCGHVLEHMSQAHAEWTMGELRRVLVPGGEVAVVGPNPLHPTAEANGVLHGGGRWPGDEHLWVPTPDEMLAMLRRWWAAEELPLGELMSAWPVVSLADWQYAFLCH